MGVQESFSINWGLPQSFAVINIIVKFISIIIIYSSTVQTFPSHAECAIVI